MAGAYQRHRTHSVTHPLIPGQHEKVQALVRSAFTIVTPDGSETESSTPRTISINTRLMWDILLHNFAAYRGTTVLPKNQVGGLFDESVCFPGDDVDESEDIIEMEHFHDPTVEVSLSNGQALPPRPGQRRGMVGQHNQDAETMQSSAPNTPMLELGPNYNTSPLSASWLMPLDMTYDPFFHFQDPGSTPFGTWEVGNL